MENEKKRPLSKIELSLFYYPLSTIHYPLEKLFSCKMLQHNDFTFS